MAIQQNKLLPVLGAIGVLIIAVILWQQFKGKATPVKAAAPLPSIPQPAPLPKERGADSDNVSETLSTVVASNKELRAQVDKIVQANEKLQAENQRLHATNAGSTPAAGPTATTGNTGTPRVVSVAEGALDSAGRAAEAFLNSSPGVNHGARAPGTEYVAGSSTPAQGGGISAPSANAYKTVAPMGYAAVEDARQNGRGAGQTHYVRTLTATDGGSGTAASAANAANAAALNLGDATRDKTLDYAYFTLPENSTLVGVQAMTSIIGRVPIDGRVTDPMQFKAMVGRDNLAANGWELPADISGMIVTGVAIGDMALSCSEGKIRSITFVFNDGTIRTVSSRGRSGGGVAGNASSSSSSGDLGFISDPYGNPCIVGKFVTNAPRYLADIVGLKTLGVAAQAYSTAQQQTTQNALGGNSTSVKSTDNYVLGQAVAGATDEVTQWMVQRLKNSFDAVVTPAGQRLVVHLDQEVRIDKAPDARRIVHRNQSASQATRGTNHGLE